MNSIEIRQKFFDFFKKQGHQIVDSAPLVNKNDPTLMFTNAGMNQFKDFFLGNIKPKYLRVANSQKCLRVSGKHNDLEEVGLDTYHHTMFEMLGNWSFGDYFKEKAILWSWKLLTEEFSLPEERLYVTVFGGDNKDKLEKDYEAYQFWKQIIPENRILFGSKKDNFWEMGDTGPCGPCSEIHIDLRSDNEIKKISGDELINKDHPLVVELWNLVFIEFNRKATQELEQLPQKHIDTGMGLERLCMAIQQKKSNYETDIFMPLINYLEKQSNIVYGTNEKKDVAMRVVADHIRAIAFSIADGQLPSNNGAGYVIKRILRRAIRYGFTYLGLKKPFIYSLIKILDKQMGDHFLELRTQISFIGNIVYQEELTFLDTLENGINKLNNNLRASSNANIVSGEFAFELYDTYGFPYDLTTLIAREQGYEVDKKSFDNCLDLQKKRSRTDGERLVEDWISVKNQENTEFVGYDQTEIITHIVKYRSLTYQKRKIHQLVLDKTPFYPEGGGQVGDTGKIICENEEINVSNTIKENDLIIHQVDSLPKKPNVPFKAKVDVEKRKSIMCNHTATHLLHHVLRKTIGKHVEQRGSLVNINHLRFDFSHFQKLSKNQISEIELQVNEMIRKTYLLEEFRNMPLKKSQEIGAMALFGEKYDENVRVIKFGESVELCGGTHVHNTGNIGFFKIIEEKSIASGIRRIEAVTAESAQNYVKEKFLMMDNLNAKLKFPPDLELSIDNLLEEKNKLEKKIEIYQTNMVSDIKKELIKKQLNKEDKSIIIAKINLPSSDALKKLSFELRREVKNLFMVLAAEIDGKPQIAVVFSDDLTNNGYNAREIVKKLSVEIKGGGGGQSFFATAGGKDIKGLDKVISLASTMI